MLQVKNWEVAFLERSIIASGNPMTVGDIDTRYNEKDEVSVKKYQDGKGRGTKLGSVEKGSGHDNFLCGIQVTFEVKFPQYWTPESQRYHWWNIVSSQSKMHRLTTMGKTEDFYGMFNKYVDKETIDRVKTYIDTYNMLQIVRSNGPDIQEKRYEAFMKALSNLPMGFEMVETVQLSYLQLKTIVSQRKNHRLKEDWQEFCRWAIEDLPQFSELTGLTL